ncbi:MAG: DUF2946 family protein [Planctomycetota bacterium]|jgi:hypothetical protein
MMFMPVWKIRFWLLLFALLGMTAKATSMPLPLHLQSTFEHDHCDESDHSDHSESPEKRVPHHDCDKCSVCKVLIGASGKFIAEAANSIFSYVDQHLTIPPITSEYVEENAFSPAVPRGPPLI